MKNNLPQLKKEIQRLIPEIMEEKQGCKISVWSSENKRDKYEITISVLSPKKGVIYGFSNGFHERPFDREWIIEILGRPTTLEDILAVLGDTYYLQLVYEKSCSDTESKFFDERIKEDGWYILCNDLAILWLLGKPLDDQSEETIKFLFNLICK